MMFFLTGLAKLLVIAGIFFVVSRLAGKSVVFFIQGLVMVYAGIASAGLRRMPRRGRHGT
jgi:hypothetical protein